MRRGSAATLTIALAALLCIVTVGLSASAAHAHSALVSSSPADGAVLSAMPHQLDLTFDEPVLVGATAVWVVDAGEAGPALRPDPSGPAESTSVTVALPAQSAGVVRLHWETLSAIDRHPVDGVVTFGVGGVGVPREPAPLPAAEPVEAVARAAAYCGLALLLGAATFVLMLRRRVPGREDWARRALAIAAVGGAIAVAGEVSLVVQTATLIRSEQMRVEDLTAVLWSGYGLRVGVRLLGLTLVLLALVPLRGRSRASGWALAGAGSLAIGAQAMTGHVSGHGDALAAPALAVHVAALSAWVGGVVCLTVVVATAVRDEVDRVHAARLLAGFAWLALPAVALVAVSGLVLTAYQVATPDALLTSPYGWVLLVKLALVAVAGGLGLRHALLLHRGREVPEPARTPGRSSLALEAVALVLAVAVAGLLTASAPPRGAEWTAVPAAAPSPMTAQPGDLIVTTAVVPGRPGANVVSVRVLETAVPALGPVSSVTVDLTGDALVGGPPSTITLAAAADGAWIAPVDLASGLLDARVRVIRAGRSPAVTVARFGLPAPGPAVRPLVLSRVALGPPLLVLALVMSLAVVTVAALLLRRRRARMRAPTSVDRLVDPSPLPVPDDVSSVPVP